MDHKQIGEIKEAFNFFDLNNDGYIDRHELREALASFGTKFLYKHTRYGKRRKDSHWHVSGVHNK